MSIKRRKIDKTNTKQLNLFDYMKEQRAMNENTLEGSLNVGVQIRMALVEGIKRSPLSRRQIAGEMSHRIGIDISWTTLDSWTAESKERNRIPAEYIPAFCEVTGSFTLLDVIGKAAGRFILPGPEALRGEIHRWREQEKKDRSEVRKRERLLDELERGRKL